MRGDGGPQRWNRLWTGSLGGDRFGNFERIAYLDESKVVVFLVLSARTKKEFEASLKGFAELVATCNFLGDQVKLPPGP